MSLLQFTPRNFPRGPCPHEIWGHNLRFGRRGHNWKYSVKAMCSTAFYAFLRVGEMTSTSPIQIGQLFKLADDSGNTVALKLVSTNHKHSYNQCPFSIVKHRQPPFCPVQLLLDYLALRSNQPGPLFANLDNNSVSRTFFTDILRLALTSCGLNSSHCKGHSFRIGAASFAKDRGMSDAQIMLCVNIFVYLLFQVHS